MHLSHHKWTRNKKKHFFFQPSSYWHYVFFHVVVVVELTCDDARVFLCVPRCFRLNDVVLSESVNHSSFSFYDIKCIKIIGSPCSVCLSIGLIILFEISAHSTNIVWKIIHDMFLAAWVSKPNMQYTFRPSIHTHAHIESLLYWWFFSLLSFSMDSLWMAYVISAFIRASSRLRLVNCQFVFDIIVAHTFLCTISMAVLLF